MKKVFLLFAVIFTSYTHIAAAQTLVEADSLKAQLPVADSSLTATASADIFKAESYLANIYHSSGIYTKKLAAKDTLKPAFISTTDEALQASLDQKIALNFNDLDEEFSAIAIDSLRARIPQKMPANVTTIKQQIALVTNDTLKAAYYQKMANYYLRYDSITIHKTRAYYQDAAIEFTMKSLHCYSRLNDGIGIMTCYSNLAKVYKDQRKFPQAKWFVLQANTMARNLNDAPRVIATLVALADVKMAIKDYSLAKRDLNEALTLSSQNKFAKQEALVQQSFAMLYSRTNQPQKAAEALKRHNTIEDSISKAEMAKRLAIVKAQDSTARAQDSTLESKKKLYTLAGKKISKSSSAKKTVSL